MSHHCVFSSFFSKHMFYIFYPNVFPKIHCYNMHNTLPYTQKCNMAEKLPIAGSQCVKLSFWWHILTLIINVKPGMAFVFIFHVCK